jgi:hypothetical protein
MGPVVHAVSSGVVVAAAAGCGLLVAALVASMLAARRSARRSAQRRSTLDAELARSRDEVQLLCRKVDELSDDVARARRAAEQDREYVITSLGGERESGGPFTQDLALPSSRPALGKQVEDRLVAALSRQSTTSPVRVRAVAAAVRVVAVAHGVRRAMAPDVLDRAAAEAHVARRRSRRDRRRQERQARRLVRAVSTMERERDQDVA